MPHSRFTVLGLTLIIGLVLRSVDASNKNVDFVVIGGGTAGSVVAAELAATGQSVLVLNIGEDASDETSKDVQFYETLPNPSKSIGTEYLFSRKETALGGASHIYPEARILGGGSSRNGLLAQRPSREDLANYESPLWTYEATLGDWKKVETYMGAVVDSPFHGTAGPIHMHTPEPNYWLGTVRAQMTAQLNLSYNNDSNGESADGVSIFPRNYGFEDGKPVRHDAYTRFLQPALGRANLEVLTKARALRINLSDNVNNTEHTVDFFYMGEVYRAKAKKEVIVAAGAFNSAQLLLLSGIGDCAELAAVNVTCKISLPGVGKKLHRAGLTSQVWYSPVTTPAPVPGSIIGAYFKSPLFAENGTNLEMAVTAARIPGAVLYLSALTQHRLSGTGSVSLMTNDPLRDPLIKFNLYGDRADLGHLVHLFKESRRILLATQIMGEISPGFAKVPLDATDDAIAAFLAGVVIPDKVVGACGMHTVVDEALKVIGTNNLRVIDTSVMPAALRTHSTSMLAFLNGMVGARMIKEQWAL